MADTTPNLPVQQVEGVSTPQDVANIERLVLGKDSIPLDAFFAGLKKSKIPNRGISEALTAAGIQPSPEYAMEVNKALAEARMVFRQISGVELDSSLIHIHHFPENAQLSGASRERDHVLFLHPAKITPETILHEMLHLQCGVIDESLVHALVLLKYPHAQQHHDGNGVAIEAVKKMAGYYAKQGNLLSGFRTLVRQHLAGDPNIFVDFEARYMRAHGASEEQVREFQAHRAERGADAVGSSTFHDLHVEADALFVQAFPHLSERSHEADGHYFPKKRDGAQGAQVISLEEQRGKVAASTHAVTNPTPDTVQSGVQEKVQAFRAA